MNKNLTQKKSQFWQSCSHSFLSTVDDSADKTKTDQLQQTLFGIVQFYENPTYYKELGVLALRK
jgi:hypothetical protein